MQPLGRILRKFAKDFGIESGVSISVLREKWTGIVGQTVAMHTHPDELRAGKLTVNVDTPQWLHHLGFYREDISKKLVAFNVKEIRFKIGRLPSAVIPSHGKPDIELNEEELAYLENTIMNISDEELRGKFRKLISHGLKENRKKILSKKSSGN